MKKDDTKKDRQTTQGGSPRQAVVNLENSDSDKRADTLFSGERYKTFLENISDGVYETDIHGNFNYFNNAFCKIFGYSRGEIQGQNFSKFMDKRNAREAYGAFTKIWVKHKGFSELIWKIIDKEGKIRTLELSAHLITNQEGKKIGFRGIARDRTEKFSNIQALQESESRYQKEYEASRRAEKRARNLLEFIPYPMVVFTIQGGVSYLNPAFTRIFGWTLDELRGKHIPYIPPNLKEEAKEGIKRLFKEKMISRIRTKRLTKDGRVLDVIMRVAVFSEDGGREGGELVILRDITRENRMERMNKALLRISMALPEYIDLGELMDYISEEVKRLLNTEGALVMLLDEVRREIFFQGVAYDDSAAKQIVKEIRIPADKSIAGKVIKSGEPIIVPDTTKEPDFYSYLDKRLGYVTRDLVEVPLRSSDRIIGVLCARNKKEGEFDQADVELLTMIAGTVALSIENAWFSRELKDAYREVTSLNRAKDRVINHLSHELKTPASVLLASLNILSKRLEALPEESWTATMERAKRNLDRILDIQYEVEDIMQDREYRAYHLISLLLEECSDELESLVAEEIGGRDLTQKIRDRIEEIFGPKETRIVEIHLDECVRERLQALGAQFSHRNIDIIQHLEHVPSICIPSDVLQKVIDGLIKNAIENTPDEGKIEITVKRKGEEGAELIVHDYGVGIVMDDQERIFEGFFSTQETMDYSSKRPFDFNAGGKGADLLRMKIFSERFNFKMEMESTRCGFIPKNSDICPGKISNCSFCNQTEDCYGSGETTFSLFFPPAPDKGCLLDNGMGIRI